MKSELAERFDSCGEAKMELFDYIEVFYNQRRRHSTLGQISPAPSSDERLWTPPSPWTPRSRPPGLGKPHRARFPTAPTALLHSTLGYISPALFERRAAMDAAVPVDAQIAPTGTWETASSAVSHSAHSSSSFDARKDPATDDRLNQPVH